MNASEPKWPELGSLMAKPYVHDPDKVYEGDGLTLFGGRIMKPEDKMDLIAKCQSHVGPGWHDILTRLITDLFERGWDGHVGQVKEKFGGLRFYIGTTDDAIFDAVHERIRKAENESLVTCEQCGKPGAPRDHSGWIKTSCGEH